MKKTTLVIRDEVNCRFEGLDVVTRRKISNAVKFVLPYARHTPAFKMGRWDGTLRFCDIGGRTYINVLDRLLPVVQKAGYEVVVEDRRQQHDAFEFEAVDTNTMSNHRWPEGHRFAGEPVQLMDHQVEAINCYLQNPQCVQSISTGAGKTMITAVLSSRCEHRGRTVVIVPSKDLVDQTHAQYDDLGMDVGVIYGNRKQYDRTHTICTWQSLESVSRRFRDGVDTVDLCEWAQDVVCVMVDECHSGRGEVLKKLMSTVFAHVPIRWGMTGTVPQDEAEAMSVTATIGPVVNRVSAVDLQHKGILANLNIDIVQTQEPVVRTYADFAQEYKHLTTDPSRIQWLANHILHTAPQGNTLVLVNRIATGEQLAELIPDSVFVSGSMASKERRSQYDDVNVSDHKIIIATYGVAAVGIDIPRIFNLYLFEPGKSFIRVIQSIGRGIRRARDKDFVQVYDVCSNTKYSKRHLTDRKRFYREQGYPHQVTKVSYD